jgi:sugar phosphate isomerase/epimerase
MKIGVKTFDNENFLEHFKDKVDFFEIMAIQKNNYDFLKKFKNIEVIHTEHQKFGVNIADPNKYNINKKAIDFAIKIANETNAKKIILHPGTLENNNCSKEQSIKFIKNINDKRIIIENMPTKNSICISPSETKEFLKQINKKLCFDINHAIGAATLLKLDYIKFIKDFIKLKPTHYHLGGQLIKENKTHLALKESDFDLKKVISLLPNNAEITLEITTDIKKTEEDIIIIKKIIKELNK